MAALVTLKIKCEDTVHRVPLREAQLSFDAIVEVIQAYYPGSVTATYLDEEGDQCTLCAATFGDFVGTGRDAGGGAVLRLELTPESAQPEHAKLAAGSPRATIQAKDNRTCPSKSKGKGKLFDKDKYEGMWTWPGKDGGAPDLEREVRRFPWVAAEACSPGDESAELGMPAGSCLTAHEGKGKAKGKCKGKGKWFGQESAQSWIYEPTDGEVAGGGERCDDNDLGSLRATLQAKCNCTWHDKGKGTWFGKGTDKGKGKWPCKDAGSCLTAHEGKGKAKGKCKGKGKWSGQVSAQSGAGEPTPDEAAGDVERREDRGCGARRSAGAPAAQGPAEGPRGSLRLPVPLGGGLGEADGRKAEEGCPRPEAAESSSGAPPLPVFLGGGFGEADDDWNVEGGPMPEADGWKVLDGI